MFTTFDGQVSHQAAHQRPDRYAHLEQPEPSAYRIARGAGYSYSAASFGEGSLVQDMSRFNRFLEFDEQNNTLTLEPGVTLHQLMAWALPRKLYFPVMPGYPLITMGGCVAVDAHGKNPAKEGTFTDWVQRLTVLHPQKGYQECSATSNPELFYMTCGGFGLSGLITSLTIRLVPLPASTFSMRRKHVGSLLEALEALTGGDSDIAYSWHDLCTGAGFGRGIVHEGDWSVETGEGGHPEAAAYVPTYRQMTSATRARLPFSLWNRHSARLANHALLLMSKRAAQHTQAHLFAASFPFAKNPYFHTFFGRSGLRELQLLVPANQAQAFLSALEFLAQTTRAPTMMGSIKTFAGTGKSLSMSGEGFLVTVVCYPGSRVGAFLEAVDQLVIEYKGQPNLTKDSRVPKAVAEAALPHYDAFKERLFAYDEARLMRSELSARLGLL